MGLCDTNSDIDKTLMEAIMDSNIQDEMSISVFSAVSHRILDILNLTHSAALGRPLWAFVWITRRCHQGCSHCYVYDNSLPHMNFNLYQQVVDKLTGLRVRYVSLFGGEPTLNPPSQSGISRTSLETTQSPVSLEYEVQHDGTLPPQGSASRRKP